MLAYPGRSSGLRFGVELALPTPAVTLSVQLLGSVEARLDGRAVDDFRYAKVRALLAALALAEAPMSRSALAGLLWPDHPETRARASLSQALTTLRRALGADGGELIGADARRVWLVPDALDVDALTVERLLDDADRHRHPSRRACRRCDDRRADAVAHYRGELLADLTTGSDLFDVWADERRRRLHRRVTAALAQLVERAEWSVRDARGIDLGRRLVALDPLVEAHRRRLVRLLLRAGRLDEARHELAALDRMVRDELGDEPDAATRALAAELGVVATSTPPSSGRLPFPSRPLIGRDELRATLTHRLRERAGGVVTLTGTGGVGKTHLALAAAHAVADHFTDGVLFADLTAVTDAPLAADAIAAAAGIGERTHLDSAHAVLAELGGRHLLVVLDNAEQVLSVAPLVAELAATGVTVLVTSRIALGLRCEWNLVVEPLAPGAAVTMLAERIADAGGIPPSATCVDAAEICRRVDRLPLAIELVAARSRGRSPAVLLAELRDPLAVLASTAGDAPARQRTMRSTIEWSTALLEPDTRRLFHRLGVFAGGWTRQAALAIAPDLTDVDARLDALVAASLVRPSADDRFTMLVTFREHAREQLAADPDAERVRDRHAAHAADVAAAAEPGLVGPAAATWAARLEADQDDLRAGFAWAMARGDTATAMRIAAGPWRFHWMRGLVREPLDRLRAVLAQPDDLPAELLTRARRAAGLLALAVGELPSARSFVAGAVDLARAHGDAGLLQLALANLGLVEAEAGALDAAVGPLTESIGLARRLGEQRVKFPLGILAGVHLRRGDGAWAAALAAEGLRLNREADDPEGTADALRTLATAMRLLGHPRRARRLVLDALEHHRALGHELGVGLDLVVLGDLAADEGDRAAAADHYRRALAGWRRVANPIEAARVLLRLATAIVEDDPATAAQLAAAACVARQRAGAAPSPAETAAIAELERALAGGLGAARAAAEALCGLALTITDAIELARSGGRVGDAPG